ncbi:MAG: efflux RND transporter periplasmic adaptor subunit [Rickettsiales bacterium]|nr:efflux RND transporter periplasmic adaptor subunit [Rickettsiales bacterium]
MKESDYRPNDYKLFVLISSIVIITAILVFHYFSHHQDEKSVAEFPVTSPWRQTLDIKKEYVAQIRAVQHIELRSLEKGYLQNIFVDEGQFVRKGQKMFQIMPLLLEAELKKAKAEYQLAKIEYDNTLILQKRNVVSKNELALTKARLDKAHAEMELAQAHLQFATVKAPFDGIMDRFQVRLGSLINEGELLTNFSDNSKMWLYFNVSEADYLDYMDHKQKTSDNVPVELVLANGSLFPQQGKIDTIEADFNNEVGNVAFRATIPNPNRILRHGETGTVLLTKKFENALVIPQKATFEVLDKKFVFVVDENNQISSRQISIAGEVPNLFIIAANLSEKDKILLEGLGKVHEGDVIKIQELDHETVRQNLQLPIK